MTTESTLEVRGLCVDLPLRSGVLHAVRGVDLHVQRGETLCIVGESGCGKSVTSLALMGLLPDRAQRHATSIRFMNEELSGASEARMQALRGNHMAMVFQDPMTALNPAYTIGDQLVEGLLRHRPGTTRAAATTRAVSLLETCGIGEAGRRLGQYPHQLSGGLRQRVMIAMALMTEPSLLIADEPTTALDATIQAQILDLLKRLQSELSLAVILVTHNFEVVRRIGDRVAVMYAGEVIETATTMDVLATPMHPYTRALLACIPSDTPGGAAQRLGFLAGNVPSLVGQLQGCQFRNRCSLASPSCEGHVPRHVVRPGHAYHCVIAPTAMPAPERSVPTGGQGMVWTRTVPTTPAIDLRDVEVTYPINHGMFSPKGELKALRGVNMTVPPGQVLGIVGESGSGKSTLARIMLGLEKPTAGEAWLSGVPVEDHGRAARARLVQPIFQDPYSSLNPRRTLAATIRLPLDIHGLGTPPERDAAVKRMMDLCGLPARLAQALPSQVSGGQRQRVAIASALIMKPEIVVCDEPTSALDVSVQAQILNLLKDLRSELQLTYVVISHDLHVIRCLADRVAVMYLGSVVEDQPTEALFAAPRHPYSQMLLSATAHGAVRAAVIGDFPNPLKPPQGCAFHPRCTRAQDRCQTDTPDLRAAGEVRVACHFSDLPLARAHD
jgi:peptide/nickel transport system ATP-binding protein